MLKAGIIDPTKVTKNALQNAASVAGLMLTTEALVSEIKEKDKPAGRRRNARRHGRHVLIRISRSDSEAPAKAGAFSLRPEAVYFSARSARRAAASSFRLRPTRGVVEVELGSSASTIGGRDHEPREPLVVGRHDVPGRVRRRRVRIMSS